MKKLNRNYLSLFEWIGFIKADPNRPRAYGYHGFRYHDGSDKQHIYLHTHPKEIFTPPAVYYQYQLLGAFYPLAKIVKDIIYTSKPYEATQQIQNDILQPVYGIGNCLKGIISITVGALLLAGYFCLLPFILIFFPLYVFGIILGLFPPMPEKFIYPISWILEGVCNLIRGVSQIIFFPLTFLIKMPLRAFLTKNEKSHYAEHKPEIQRLAKKGLSKLSKVEEIFKPNYFLEWKNKSYTNCNDAFMETRKLTQAIREVTNLLYEVHRKYHKSVRKGWATDLNEPEVQSTYKNLFNVFDSMRSELKLKEYDVCFKPNPSHVCHFIISNPPNDLSLETKTKAEAYFGYFRH